MATQSFLFQAQELPQKLYQASEVMPTGYWCHEFTSPRNFTEIGKWHLALSQGQVIFSGTQRLSWLGFLTAIQRYIPRLRSDYAQRVIGDLQQKFTLQDPFILLAPLRSLYEINLIRRQDVLRALRLKILADFDIYLFDGAGRSIFLSAPELTDVSLNLGFELKDLLAEAKQRKTAWDNFKNIIPSMQSVPIINTDTIQHSYLTGEQKKHLENLVLKDHTLDEIASFFAQDSLQIAKGFAKLVNQGLVTLQSPETVKAQQIVIVDDSHLMLKQFQNLVKSWGYSVKSLQDPANFMQTVLHANPAAIFIDINMPGVNGFDLVKQIRRQPTLASVPLVMLTAERTLSNNWRSQWSGCKFLSKPLNPQEIPDFQEKLFMLLEEFAPIQQHN